MQKLARSFYNRPPQIVAPDLLGKVLVRKMDNQTLTGRIVEVEAYLGSKDGASHSYKGKTKRNQSLYLPAGHAYIHSMHRYQLLDIVVDAVSVPHSVLIRSLEPLRGIETMRQLRHKQKLVDLTTGPGKLTQAFGIDRQFDGYDLVSQDSLLTVCDDGYIPPAIVTSTRIGISRATDLPLRFYIKNNPYLSRRS